MILQISSGNGPLECELAVGKFLEALRAEIPDMQIISETKTKYANCYRSVAVSTDLDMSHLQGTIKWISKSPFRPKHKRKNWFVQVKPYAKPVYENKFSLDDVRFETARAGGPGG